MRVQKIEKINFLRFKNFSWETGLGTFSDKANILFGWNGSGKTTLSRLMRILETGVVPEGCKLKIKTDTQTILESDSSLNRTGDIRVFNNDYVSESLGGSKKIPHIFFAGKDAVDYSVEEAKLVAKREEVTKLTLPVAHIEIAKNTAKLIKEVAGINSHRKELTGGATYAVYTQDDFEKRVGDIQSKIKDGTFKSSLELIKTEGIATLKKQLVDSSIITQVDAKISTSAKWLIDNTKKINETLSSTPTQIKSERVGSLKQDQSSWMREGVSLHFDVYPNLESCLFCESPIKNRQELLQHFSEAVVKATAVVSDYLVQVEKHTTDLAGITIVTDEQGKRILKLRSDFDLLTPALREKQNAISQARTVVNIDHEVLKPFIDPAPINATKIAYEIEKHYVAEQFDAYSAAKKEYDEAVRVKKALEH